MAPPTKNEAPYVRLRPIAMIALWFTSTEWVLRRPIAAPPPQLFEGVEQEAEGDEDVEEGGDLEPWVMQLLAEVPARDWWHHRAV